MKKEYPYKYVSLDELETKTKIYDLDLIISNLKTEIKGKPLYVILNAEPCENQKYLNYAPEGITIFQLYPTKDISETSILNALIKQIVKQFKDSAKLNGGVPDLKLLEELVSSLPKKIFENYNGVRATDYKFIIELYKKLLDYLTTRDNLRLRGKSMLDPIRKTIFEESHKLTEEISKMLLQISADRTRQGPKRTNKL